MNKIKFRMFKKQDIPNVLRWIRDSEVLDVWDSAQNKSDDKIREKYEKRINNQEIDTYVILVDDIDVGLIQTYTATNIQDFGIIDHFANGIDLFIGIPSYRNKGLGTAVIKEFIQTIVLQDTSVKYIVIDPEVANERAIRAYEKVGFLPYNVAFDNHSKLLTLYMKMKV